MAGKINLLGHPVHPMLIVYPLAFLTAAVVLDIVYWINATAFLATVSYWCVVVGVLSGVFAAIFGFIDWLALPNGTRAKRIGLWHAGVMDVVIILFAVSWWLRHTAPDAPSVPTIILEVIGILFGLLGGWLGGELVYRLSVGVDFDAHVNSPSSFSGRPASDNKETLPASQRS
jgi:uncharacterized membrane protein